MISIAPRAAAGLLLLGVVPPVTADRFDGVRSEVARQLQERSVPGLAVAVWRNGKILWEEGFGWADMENRIPVTEHTPFALASLSKTLTATGLMTLVQAREVELDRPVNDYLGMDPVTVHNGDPREVTVRRVANHTSGLAASAQFFYGDDARVAPSMSETIRRYGIVVDPPGERYRYSNIGYGILGHLIARVSGQSYADYMRKAVFLPLGMTRSSVYLTPELEPYQAIRYDFDRKPIPTYASAEPASAMIYSSAHDLARFGMFLLKDHRKDQRAILSDASIDEMSRTPIRLDEFARPVRAARPGEDGYDIGLIVTRQGGYRTVGHEGSMSGVSTVFSLVPEKNLGVLVLANADQGAGGVATELLRSVLDWQEEVPPAPGPASVEPEPGFQPTEALQGRWEGVVHTYEGEVPMALRVMATGDVHVRIGGGPKFMRRRQETLLTDISFRDGQLIGRALALIETPDSKRHPHTLELRLQLRDGVLNGAVMSDSIFEGLWLHYLPYWAELRKASGEGTGHAR